VSKFAYGAWIVVLVLPILVFALHSVGAHHDRLIRHVTIKSAEAAQHLVKRPMRHHMVIAVGGIDRVVLQAVAYARTLDARVEAVHVTDNLASCEKLRRDWALLDNGVPLVILDSPIRSYSGALLRYLDFIQRREGEHTTFVTLVLPEILPTRWWHPLLHNYFAWRLKWTLLFRPHTAVTSVPYEVRD
jgi:hypothetical protein